jgi:filamentous hemagglutinin family protein
MNSSLNRIFRVIWSKVQMTWIAVSEIATAHGKQQSLTRITRSITAAALMTGGAVIAAPPVANQLPTGGVVSAGSAAITTSGNSMTVTQSSNRAAINWNGFDIGSAASVNFVQPSSQAIALNRVNSPNPSQIYGQLSSNGQVYLINPSGVFFAPGSQVNVGGIVATTHQMSDAAFMAGSTKFERNGSTGKVINEGTIQTSLNGYIAMLAPEVRNSGLLLAQSGTVALAAAETVTLNFGPTSKLDSITVTAANLNTLIENRHAIKAPNGLVILSARSAAQLGASVVNSGTIEAKGIAQQGGRILLEASTVSNTGTLDVSSDTAQAGTIQINGKNVSLSGSVIATSPVQGGTLKVQATQSLTVGANIDVSGALQGGQVQMSGSQVAVANSTINADGDIRGGNVALTATNDQQNNPVNDPDNLPTLPTTLAVSGLTGISSRSRRGLGGNATLTGDHITLDGNTTINVSGALGGGNVLVGGDWQGSNGTYQATTVLMNQSVTIDASATENGHGGKVVLWSDLSKANGWTNVYGGIYAKAGVNGGDGGKIETSGHSLDIGGATINAEAAAGKSGLWLIDPYDYNIDSSAASTISSSLNSTDVLVTTSSSGGTGVVGSGSGNITISGNINKTSGAATTLTLNADNWIGGTGNIYSSGNRLSTIFNTGASQGIYSGYIYGNVSVTKLGAGALALNYANAYTGGTELSAGTLGIYNNSALGTGLLTAGNNTNVLFGRSVSNVANNISLTGAVTFAFDRNVEFLLVGGGAGGGGGAVSSGYPYGGGGGGGGAGQMTSASYQISSGSNSVIVGSGGDGGAGGRDNAGWNGANGTSGGTSSFYGYSAAGGIYGVGAGINTSSQNGGAGGASGANLAGGTSAGGGGGGGGATTVGSNAAGGTGGTGGAGATSLLTGLLTTYGVGGNGGSILQPDGANGANGSANTGSGGSGGGGSRWYAGTGGTGGSGLVVIRYIGATAGSGGTVSSGSGAATGYTLHSFTTVGTDTLTLSPLAVTLSGNISGAGSAIMNAGGGTMTMSGTNTYTGSTNVTAGTLVVSGGGLSSVTRVNVSSGASYNVSASNSVGSIAGAGVINIGTGYTFTAGADNTSTTFSGCISGTGNFTKSGSGILTLSGTNNATGSTNVTSGTLEVTGYLSDSTAVNVSSGASYNVSSSDTVGSIAGAGTINLANSRLLVSGGDGTSTTFSGVMAGLGSLSKIGSGTLSLTGVNSYSGNTTIGVGTLMIGNGTANGSLNGVSNIIINGAVLALNRSDSITLANNISGTGGITISQNNNVELTGNASYTGNTSLAGGMLTYTNNVGPASANFTGTGSLVIQPSTSFSSAYNFSANVASAFTGVTIGSVTNTANVTISRAISVNGSINLFGGNIALNVNLDAGATTGSWLSLNTSGNVTQNASSVISNGVRFGGGGGNLLLTNTANQIKQLAASGVANMTVNNSYAAAALGLNDISATGNIRILNTVGLAVSGNISTSSVANSTSTPALLLAAGYDQAAGNSGVMHSLIVNGTRSISVGNGGLGLIYTGSVTNSWNLNTIVPAGSGRFRYNTNTSYSLTAATPGFNVTAAPLTVDASASNLYVMYREQPSLSISATNSTSVYGTTLNTAMSSTAKNGDTLTQIFGGANVPTLAISGATSTAGFYVAGNHSLNITGPSTNYLGYATPSYSNATANITQASLTVTGVVASDRAYNGTAIAGFSNNGSLLGVLSNSTSSVSDVVTLNTSGNFSSKNVGDNLVVTLSSTVGGADAANYNVTQPTGIVANITKKTVSLSDVQTYSGSNVLTNVAIVTGVAGETLTYSGAVANSSQVADNSSNYITAITLGNQVGANLTSGGLASNYQLPTLNVTNAPVTINAAPLGISANGAYNGLVLFANQASGINYTLTGLQNGELINTANLTINNANVASGNHYVSSLAVLTGNASMANYVLNPSFNNATGTNTTNTFTLLAANLTITANSTSTQYGLGTVLGTTAFTSSGLQNNETIGGVTLASIGAANTTNVGLYNITATNAAGGSFTASNYNIGYVNGTLNVTQAPITLLAGNLTRVYGDANPSTDTVTLTSGTLYNGNAVGNATVATTAISSTAAGQTVNLTPSAVVFTNGSASNYNITYANGSLSINQANLTITANNTSKIYGQTLGFTGTEFTSTALKNSETLTSANLTSAGATATAAVNGGTNYTIAINNATGANGFVASNYNITYANGNLTVNPAPLGIAATGTYSGTTLVNPSSYTLTGLVNGETVNSIGSVVLNNANTNLASRITTINIANGTASMANYQLNSVTNTAPNTTTTNSFVMAKANVTVTPDNGAIFVGQSLPGSYNVSLNGFVNGEAALTAAGLTAGTVTNAATSNSSAGTYNLSATGWSATNYNFGYSNGTFTIVPANRLLIQTGATTSTYGTNATIAPTSVQYLATNLTIANLTQTSVLGNNTYLYSDPNGGTVTISLTASNGTLSAGGNLNARSYQMGGTVINQTSSNFNGTSTTIGTLAVAPLAVTPSANNVSKIYDGTTSMSGMNITLTPAAMSGDDVMVSGSGAFSQANAGTNLSYNVSGLILGGTDAGNYVLSGGASSFSGNNGIIVPRTVTLSANQTYSGLTTLTNVSIGNLVGNQTLNYAGNASSKNLSDNGTNYIANLTLSNGANGGLSSNYQLPVLNVTNAPVTINRLNSVTWTGGSTGNWFDPANWAGGAVPDLNNVANVILPAGVTVYFNNTIVPPAQAGTVSVDSITGASANLSQSAGTLSVGLGGITLYTLNQSNGTLTSLGPINLANYIQSGGNLTGDSNFTTINFDQSGGVTLILGALNAANYTQSNGTTTLGSMTVNGSYSQTGGQTNVTGNANITTAGTMLLGNLTVGGALNANSTGGNINQTSGTLMSITGLASFNALSGVITLNPGNSFAGGDSIIDINGDRNRPASWVYQSTMTQGGTTLFTPLPKTQTKDTQGTLKSIAFNDDVILLGQDNNDFEEINSDVLSRLPTLKKEAETDSEKLVSQGGKVFLLSTKPRSKVKSNSVGLAITESRETSESGK